MLLELMIQCVKNDFSIVKNSFKVLYKTDLNDCFKSTN